MEKILCLGINCKTRWINCCTNNVTFLSAYTRMIRKIKLLYILVYIMNRMVSDSKVSSYYEKGLYH